MNWRRALIAVALILPVLVLLLLSMGNDPRLIRSPLIGEAAPDFTLAVLEGGALTTESGDSIRLADHLGDIVVLNFWASWCGPCRIEHPALTAAAAEYRDRGVHFYGVLYRDRPESARRWLDQLGENYPTGLDPASRTAIDYGLVGVPETFFIGRDGRVAHKHIGPIPPAELARQIENLLAADPARAEETEAEEVRS